MADALTFDFDQVTPRMLVDFKAKTGTSLMALVGEDGDIDVAEVEPEVLAGFIWLALRMSGQPDATWDEALDVPFTSLTLGSDDEVDPTTASSAS